jgi:hypothetical protein
MSGPLRASRAERTSDTLALTLFETAISASEFEVGSEPRHFVLRYCRVEIHGSARRHRVRDADIRHAADHAIVVVDLDPEADPPRCLQSGRTEPGTSSR